MRRPALILFLVLLCAAGTAAAQSLSAATTPGMWDEAVAWVFAQQRLFHRELAKQLTLLSTIGTVAAAWGMIMVSFLYGVFHAAGPGHGKAVIATYLLTHENHVRRGVWLATASALCQGLVAVILVFGLVLVAGWLPLGRQEAVNWSERISFILLAGMGAFFTLRALIALVRAWRRPAHQHDHAAHAHHHHDHVHDDSCGVTHGPTSEQIERAQGLRATIGILLSIGLRPCSGAVLVLVLANALGLIWAGLTAVLAMSIGTALTVAILALMTVKARNVTAALFGGAPRQRQWMGSLVALAGGIVIFLFGLSLLMESYGATHPLML
jgi:nickel/cobalt exporter